MTMVSFDYRCGLLSARGFDQIETTRSLIALGELTFAVAGLAVLVFAVRNSARRLDWFAVLGGAFLIGRGLAGFVYESRFEFWWAYDVYPDRWLELFSILSGLLLLLICLICSLRVFLGLRWRYVALFALLAVATQESIYYVTRTVFHLPLDSGLSGIALDQAIALLPELLTLAVIAMMAGREKHPAAANLNLAAAAFGAALILRGADLPLCETLRIGDYRFGTYFLATVLLALSAYWVLRGAQRHGLRQAASRSVGI